MILHLFTSTSDENVINKTLVKDDEIEIKFKRTNDIMKPDVLLRTGNPVNSNYAYLDKLNKYYFIDSIEQLTNGLYRLHMRIDVLETYKEDILNSYAVITEQEQNINPYYNADYSFEVRKERELIESDTVVPMKNNNVLVAIGG